ncbi:hypothetical protein ACH3XW_41970 [Acanthocheilonema viteae]
MVKIIMYLVFFIYCAANPRAGAGAGGAAAQGAAADIITDREVDKFWDSDQLLVTTEVKESTMTSCDKMEDGRLLTLEKFSLLFLSNAVNLIK